MIQLRFVRFVFNVLLAIAGVNVLVDYVHYWQTIDYQTGWDANRISAEVMTFGWFAGTVVLVNLFVSNMKKEKK